MKTNKRLLIGITGRMGSGKTTIAKQMVALIGGNAELFSIGQKIKDIVFELDLPYRRDVLQDTGDFFRTYDELVWIKYLMNHIEKQKNQDAIIDDIRYAIEGKYLKSKGFLIVRAVSSSVNRRNRISSREKIDITENDWKDWNTHTNEQETKTMEVDFEIDNDGSTEDLSREISKFINSLNKKKRNLHEFINK